MSEENYKRFADISFDDFRGLASDESLSCYEKIGFPDSYRKGKEHLIFNDLKSKVSQLDEEHKNI